MGFESLVKPINRTLLPYFRFYHLPKRGGLFLVGRIIPVESSRLWRFLQLTTSSLSGLPPGFKVRNATSPFVFRCLWLCDSQASGEDTAPWQSCRPAVEGLLCGSSRLLYSRRSGLGPFCRRSHLSLSLTACLLEDMLVLCQNN